MAAVLPTSAERTNKGHFCRAKAFIRDNNAADRLTASWFAIKKQENERNEAYKNWICFALVSNTSVLKKTKNMRRPCLSLCKSVMQKCPYLPPAVPSDGDVDNLVQIGYSAFNCITEEEWEQEYKMDSEDCLNVHQMDECQQNNQNSLIQPTMSPQIPTTGSYNLTSNSTNIGNR